MISSRGRSPTMIDLVEEGMVDGIVDRGDGALVDVRDRDETVEQLAVREHGFGDGGSGPTKLSFVGLDLVGDEELDVLRDGRAKVWRVRLQKQLDERVAVARNDFAGEGIGVNSSPSCDEDENAGVRVLWSLEQLTRRRGAGQGKRAGTRIDADPLDPPCGLI